jgi:hypothetical protein
MEDNAVFGIEVCQYVDVFVGTEGWIVVSFVTD